MIYEFVVKGIQAFDKDILKRYKGVRKRTDILSFFAFNKNEYYRKKRLLSKLFTFEEAKLEPLPQILPKLSPYNFDGFQFINCESKKAKKVIIVKTTKSFGFDHPATRLVLEKLTQFKQAYRNKRFLDVGCGSGILSVYALKTGAKKVYGIDIDPFAIKEAKSNVRLNGYDKKRIKLLLVDVGCLKKAFSCIVANVPINVHYLIGDDVKAVLELGGVLITGGYLTSKKGELQSIYKDLSLISEDEKDEWCVMVFKK